MYPVMRELYSVREHDWPRPTNPKALLIAILVFSASVSLPAAVAAELQETAAVPIKVKTFLETSDELRNYSRYGYTSSFTGELRPVPEDLQIELNRELPEFKFHIANMTVLIDPPQTTYDLILITDADTGEVKSFLWGAYWMIRPARSFSQLLMGQHAKSKEEALNKVKSLAKLIGYTAKAIEVGKARAVAGKLQVQLLKDREVVSIVEVKIDEHLNLGRLSIKRADGKEMRYFV